MMVAKKVSMTERQGFRVAGASEGVQLETGDWRVGTSVGVRLEEGGQRRDREQRKASRIRVL
jgi:hypothetical protein